MAKPRQFRQFMCDFETTVYEGQQHTEVWASAVVELYNEEVNIFHSIDETLEFFIGLNTNVIGYYHNLKFDGTFWLDYLMVILGYKLAANYDENGKVISFKKDKEMKNGEIKYLISEQGQWYHITIKANNKIISFRDSFKLLPFSVSKIGKSFGTKHKKLDMAYEGFRYAGCEITQEERDYIANDVLVVKEALEIMFDEGHNKMTIGSCCLDEYKKSIGKDRYKEDYPQLFDIAISSDFGEANAGEYIRGAYKGGWCYVVEGKDNRILTNGCTADVNSLYPSMMSSESGNRYPIGFPTFWKGNYIPDEALKKDSYFFVRVKTRFYLKDGYLPFIQIKSSLLYRGNEMLKTSDVYDRKTDKYYTHYIKDGERIPARPVLTLTMTDYQLIKEHYNLVDFEILDGCYFYSMSGIFDEYIEKYKQQKLNSKGARRELAKLFLNNLYGKMAASTDSSFKVGFIKEDKTIGFYLVEAHEKEAGYIAIGAAITSYARNFTIRAAQKNFYGVNERGFIYADTDSIHCDLPPNEIKGIKVHEKNFCCWKLEGEWDEGIFARQKTYIEHIIREDGEEIEPYYNVRCAGMPEKCKKLFIASLGQGENDEILKGDKLNANAKEFLKTKRYLTDFKIGLCIPNSLKAKHIRGGTLLVEHTYEMKPK